MKKAAVLAAALLCAVLAGCGAVPDEGKPKVVATTTIVADTLEWLSGGLVKVDALMPPGVDPHLYKASAGDVKKLVNADMVVYNGLGLEGKMGLVLENIKGKIVFAAAEGIDEEKLLTAKDNPDVYDPHVWFDVLLWKECAARMAEGLKELDPGNAAAYDEKLRQYLAELDRLHEYISKRAEEIEANKRVLITAHDAFAYFGRRYGFEVRGLQGINTGAEAGTSDVSALSDFIAQKRIGAVFFETLVPPRNVEALRDAVRARGHTVQIGGELYTDSVGTRGTAAGSYTGMMKANADTIVGALKQG